MTARRDQRHSHVRPRPASTGRPAPVKVKPRAPAPTRLAGHRPIRRGNGLPIIAKVVLIAAVIALSAGVLFVGAKGLGSVVGGLGSTVGGFVGKVTATSTPEPSIATISDPPSLVQPTEPYTTESTVDLVVTVPAALVGDTTQRIRVFLALADQPEAPIEEVPLSDNPKTIIPVELTKGINDFSVTIKGPGGESDHSAVVRYVLDNAPPRLTITSPKNGAIVNRKAVTITGKTQARTTLVARNAANGSSIAGTAESDGGFSLSLAMSNGSNAITITATDPAGNVSEAKLSVKRGTGELTVALSSSTYQIKQAKLPEPVTLTRHRHRPRRARPGRHAGDLHDQHARYPDHHPGRDHGRAGQGDLQDHDPQGRRRRPGECDGPRLEHRLRVDRGLHGHHDLLGAQRSTAGAVAATIRAWRCGAVRTVGLPRLRHPAAGSAGDPAPPARPARTSVDRSRPSSDTAVWTASTLRSEATRSAPAGRLRRHSPN